MKMEIKKFLNFALCAALTLSISCSKDDEETVEYVEGVDYFITYSDEMSDEELQALNYQRGYAALTSALTTSDSLVMEVENEISVKMYGTVIEDKPTEIYMFAESAEAAADKVLSSIFSSLNEEDVEISSSGKMSVDMGDYGNLTFTPSVEEDGLSILSIDMLNLPELTAINYGTLLALTSENASGSTDRENYISQWDLWKNKSTGKIYIAMNPNYAGQPAQMLHIRAKASSDTHIYSMSDCQGLISYMFRNCPTQDQWDMIYEAYKGSNTTFKTYLTKYNLLTTFEKYSNTDSHPVGSSSYTKKSASYSFKLEWWGPDETKTTYYNYGYFDQPRYSFSKKTKKTYSYRSYTEWVSQSSIRLYWDGLVQKATWSISRDRTPDTWYSGYNLAYEYVTIPYDEDISSTWTQIYSL